MEALRQPAAGRQRTFELPHRGSTGDTAVTSERLSKAATAPKEGTATRPVVIDSDGDEGENGGAGRKRSRTER